MVMVAYSPPMLGSGKKKTSCLLLSHLGDRKEKASSLITTGGWVGKSASSLITTGGWEGKNTSSLLTTGGWEGKNTSSLLPSLDGRGWGRVIIEHRDLIQKLGVHDIHHNTGGLTTNKKTNSLREKKKFNVISKKVPSQSISSSPHSSPPPIIKGSIGELLISLDTEGPKYYTVHFTGR
jgi:hypothetical protein